MAEKTVTVSQTGGVGFVGLLTILFIALKLTGVISWPWLWVLSPLWIGFGLWLIMMIIFVIIAALVVGSSNKW